LRRRASYLLFPARHLPVVAVFLAPVFRFGALLVAVNTRGELHESKRWLSHGRTSELTCHLPHHRVTGQTDQAEGLLGRPLRDATADRGVCGDDASDQLGIVVTKSRRVRGLHVPLIRTRVHDVVRQLGKQRAGQGDPGIPLRHRRPEGDQIPVQRGKHGPEARGKFGVFGVQ
jgi:hypothetical protein